MGKRFGALQENPTLALRSRKPSSTPLQRPLSDKDVKRAIESAAGALRVWIAMSTYQGMHCGDIASLARADIDTDTQPWLILKRTRRGTNKVTLTIHPLVRSALLDHGLPLQGPLFINTAAEKVSRSISDYVKSIGIRGSAMSLVAWHRAQVERNGRDFDRETRGEAASAFVQPPTADEQNLLALLDTVSMSAAASYRQAIRDLRDRSRVSFRGPAHELRSSLLDIIDRLAPDEDVVRQGGFRFEPGRSTPTLSQKARFALRNRMSRTGAAPGELSFDLIEEYTAKMCRAVYSKGSMDSHVQAARSDALQMKLYTDALLSALLG